jgi:hypothetical protein
LVYDSFKEITYYVWAKGTIKLMWETRAKGFKLATRGVVGNSPADKGDE